MGDYSTEYQKLWALGYKNLVPIIPPKAGVSPKSSLAKRPGALGKAVGIKGEDGLWRGFDWLRSNAPTKKDIERWATMGAGVGIRTGEGLVALDIDTLDPELAARAVAAAHTILGTAPTRVGKAPKQLLLYATAEEIPYQRVEFSGCNGNTERIELLSKDRQFVAYGIHPGTEKPYAWTAPLVDSSELTTITPQQVSAFFREIFTTFPKATKPVSDGPANDRANINQSNLKGDLEHVKRAVSAIPNTTDLFPTYDDYIRVGAAIKGATQDAPQLGEELFLQWAARWENGNDPEIAIADYGRIKAPYELGARYLYDLADRTGDGRFDISHVFFQPIEDDEHDPFIHVERVEREQRSTQANKHFSFVPLKDAANDALTTSTLPLIKGLLDQGALSILYGESNTGKTFVAMDIAYHIATGTTYANMKVHQHAVVYVAAEGGRGAKKRAAALRKKFGNQADDAPFYFILSPVNLLQADADLKPLIQSINNLQQTSPHPIGLIVIDTLSRALAGGDENTSTDMGAIVKHFDILRDHTQAHLMAVHHSGKDRAKGARGHSLLRAATDTEIEIADNQISVTKQRDLDKSFATKFQLETHILGEDADGDFVTSCTVKLVSAATVVVGVATPREQDILSAISALAATSDCPEKGVSSTDILSFLHGGEAGKPEVATLKVTLGRMLVKNLVTKVSRGFWKVTDESNKGNKAPSVTFCYLSEDEDDVFE